jgi:hypothetical protein
MSRPKGHSAIRMIISMKNSMTRSGIFLTFILLSYTHFTPSFGQCHLYIHLSFCLCDLHWDQSPLLFVRHLLTFTILARLLRGHFLPPWNRTSYLPICSTVPLPLGHSGPLHSIIITYISIRGLLNGYSKGENMELTGAATASRPSGTAHGSSRVASPSRRYCTSHTTSCAANLPT